MNLRQADMLSKAGFPYIACRTFTKNKERR